MNEENRNARIVHLEMIRKVGQQCLEKAACSRGTRVTARFNSGSFWDTAILLPIGLERKTTISVSRCPPHPPFALASSLSHADLLHKLPAYITSIIQRNAGLFSIPTLTKHIEK